MNSVSNYDCNAVLSNFGYEGKFSDTTKNLVENRSNPYKVVRQLFEFGVSVVDLTQCVPLNFLPLFQAIKGIASIAFDSYAIYSKILKINRIKENNILSRIKIEKWTDKSELIDLVKRGDREILLGLKEKYQNRLQNSLNCEATPDKIRIIRWNEYLGLINSHLETNDVAALEKLSHQLNFHNSCKIEYLKTQEKDLDASIKKQYVGIAVLVGSIALEAICLVGLAFSSIDGGITYAIIKTTLTLAVSGVKAGSQLWWGITQDKNKGVVGLKTLEQICISVAKTKLIPSTPFFHPSLIRGLSKAIFAGVNLFHNQRRVFDNYHAIADCKSHIEKKEVKRKELLAIGNQIASGRTSVMRERLALYREKIEEAELNLLHFQSLSAREVNPDELSQHQAMCGIIRSQINKWNEYVDVLNHALETNDLNDAKIAADKLSFNIRHKVANWKLSEQLHYKKNLQESMNTAMNIVNIARFIFLVSAVSLTLFGLGISFGTALLITVIVVNALHLGYFYVNQRMNAAIDRIVDYWSKDEILPDHLLLNP
jgi:hypothetical protein